MKQELSPKMEMGNKKYHYEPVMDTLIFGLNRVNQIIISLLFSTNVVEGIIPFFHALLVIGLYVASHSHIFIGYIVYEKRENYATLVMMFLVIKLVFLCSS